MAFYNTPPPGKGDKTTVTANGTDYGVRVVEFPQRMLMVYYGQLEEEFSTRQEVRDKVDESLVNTGNDGTGKTKRYRAIPVVGI